MLNRTPKKKAGRPLEWLPHEIILLKTLYLGTDNQALAKILNKSVSAIRGQATRLRLKKEIWPPEQEKYLKDNWYELTAAQIAKNLNKTRWAVINKYRHMNKNDTSL